VESIGSPAPAAAYAALLTLAEAPPVALVAEGATPSRQQLAVATQALALLTDAAIAGEAARAAAAVSWASRDEAMAARDRVADALFAAADRAGAADGTRRGGAQCGARRAGGGTGRPRRTAAAAAPGDAARIPAGDAAGLSLNGDRLDDVFGVAPTWQSATACRIRASCRPAGRSRCCCERRDRPATSP